MAQTTVQEPKKLSVEELQKLNITSEEVDGIRKIRSALLPRIQKAKSSAPKGKKTEDYTRLARIASAIDGSKQEQNKKTPEDQTKAKVENIDKLRKAVAKVTAKQNIEYKDMDGLLRAGMKVFLDLPIPPKPERKPKENKPSA